MLACALHNDIRGEERGGYMPRAHRASSCLAAKDVPMHGYYGFPGWGGAAGFPWMSAITWAIGLALLASIVYFGLKGRRIGSPRKDDALDILAERYARGEVSKDEYLEASELLKKR